MALITDNFTHNKHMFQSSLGCSFSFLFYVPFLGVFDKWHVLFGGRKKKHRPPTNQPHPRALRKVKKVQNGSGLGSLAADHREGLATFFS